MSKADSHQFSGTKGERIAQGLIPENQKKQVIECGRKMSFPVWGKTYRTGRGKSLIPLVSHLMRQRENYTLAAMVVLINSILNCILRSRVYCRPKISRSCQLPGIALRQTRLTPLYTQVLLWVTYTSTRSMLRLNVSARTNLLVRIARICIKDVSRKTIQVGMNKENTYG